MVTINLVVYDGEKYLRHVLDSVLAQTYPHELIELNIFDNNSSDKTKEIATSYKLRTTNFANFSLVESRENLGMWPGQEKALESSHGKYVVALSVDIILDKDFVKNTVEAMEKDEKIGALQPKLYQWSLTNLDPSAHILKPKIIDTVGFQIFRSRKITNIGHGQEDRGQFNEQKGVFAVEGAVPVLRREALESVRIDGRIIDHDYFWYGDDLDLLWRMRLFGWKQVYNPQVIAWHDRSTTKGVSHNWLGYFRRVKERRKIPIKKRRLDWSNVRFTIIKNDYIINMLKDLPRIAAREIAVLGYTLLFEPMVLLEAGRFFRLLPRMLKCRAQIMKLAKATPQEMRKWLK
ncbi:MAG: hypothetical protein A2750_03645 [Candidatus Yanofskybacteria bacterium RIFCSPHIGHO2_01_FULL_45_42]|uniref:Glycosyltransferase 2-like domain-containing protein n=3 Tax=Candidatus Yanofskyibacteriota TaxID=1752733 RepID=A0A1F8EZ58_9BACT|nr:MAG: hypothetical protein A2750_03645 [Candidatus Yanofskybacteria bacterium RIFCSPHIGHO2_01_FULL_45_42]OGN16878.1 MAG: hypothetical protein A3C81_03195 [Candidatus Yanofskybacteria bacterium RIFCSPHIGHO2_02_FULL_46_19]OGN27565.1 MAG: hypothetical protein A3B17_00845 [Candidatus Yanofskybacteria bacterium RIFCSPLOWO2_01_FULL_45_72]OGN32030.1 MAG: hypothetical protein A3J01_03055 [Candidatus Yanofskybacteria bacterium RIFCSPLOWO2_02_FULL_45_18]